jgi:L-alanine-DL-glutamate epimerase-like enolase superfamily enzyme
VTETLLDVATVPFKRPEIWAKGVRRGVTHVIVRVLTDEGAVGLGEYPALPTPEAAVAFGRTVAEQLVGHEPGRVEPLMAQLRVDHGWQSFPRYSNMVLAGFDIALWDLVGKQANLPLYRLFGGAYWPRPAIMYFLPNGDVAEMVAEARAAVGQGFGTIYIKVGIDERRDVEVVHAVRAAIGESVRLRVDANEAWSAKEAIRIGRKLADCDLEFIEQPTPARDVRALREVKRALDVPVAANQTSWSNDEVREVLELRAADVILTDAHQAGGMMAFRKAAAAAELFGVPVVRHSWGELGVTGAAHAHLVAATANCTMANQAYLPYLDEDILADSLLFERGAVVVPEGPGLGVALDEARFAAAQERFQRGELHIGVSPRAEIRAALGL